MGQGTVHVMEMIPSGWVYILDPEPADLHGIACIKGRWVISNRDNWLSDRPVYVPVAHIKTITLFDSIEEYIEAGKRHRLSDFPKGDAPRQS